MVGGKELNRLMILYQWEWENGGYLSADGGLSTYMLKLLLQFGLICCCCLIVFEELRCTQPHPLPWVTSEKLRHLGIAFRKRCGGFLKNTKQNTKYHVRSMIGLSVICFSELTDRS